MLLTERLRKETRAEHEAIEASLGVLMSPGLTHATFANVVARFYGFFSAWEPAAAATLSGTALHEMFDARRKSEALEADLIALGRDRATVSDIERCPAAQLPCTKTLGAVLGSMYVTEGSTLGGQIISKHLERHLQLRDRVGYTYFRGAEAQTMPRWQAFKSIVNQSVASNDHDSVVSAAADTFTKMRVWLATPPA